MEEKDALAVIPNPDAEAKKSSERESAGSFKHYLRIFQFADAFSWALNGVALIASIASGTTLPLMTVIFGKSIAQFNSFAVGSFSSSDFNRKINGLVLWYVYLFVVRLVLSYISTLCISIAAIRTTRSIRQAFLQSTLRQEIWHFDKQDNGATASQVITNGNRINQGIAEKLSTLFQSLSVFFTAFIVALAVQWKLTLITMSIIPAIFLFTTVCIALDAPIESKVMKIYSKAAVTVEESFSSMRTIHAFWANTKMAKTYDSFLQEAHTEGKKKSILYGVLFSTEYFCVYCGIALAYWQGYRMFVRGEIPDVSKVFTVVFSALIAASAISMIAPQFSSFTNAAAAAAELFEILDKPSKLDPLAVGGLQPVQCDGNIEVRSLRFAYPSRPGVPILKGLNISIPAGKTTALVGASGCGKSTLVGLLERWYEREAGDIMLDGHDISQYNTRWLRNQIRLVQQEPVLFRGTVFQNVANGFADSQLELSEEKKKDLVREACVASNAHDFIEQLPNGYYTEVGDRAAMLSGGQRQRIAIARSIISNPRILLLDEATSALDPKAERIVQSALDKVTTNRTTLVIAHKLSTVQNADNIAVISNGIVVEQGTHDELLIASGHYARLVAAQDLGDESDAADITRKETNPILARQASALEAGKYTTEEDIQHQAGTLGYSLLRCIWIMLSEQKSLYVYQLISIIACCIGAATFPGQAVLYSRILGVFNLPKEEGQQQANFYALMFFVIALGNLFAYFVIGITCNVIGQEVTHRYRLEMFENISKQDMEFFDRPENSSGALTAKITSLPSSLQDLFGANILLILIVLVNVVSSSILALVYGWKLALVTIFGGLPLLVGSGYARIRMETKLEQQTSERFSESASLASESVIAIKTVSSLTLEPAILLKYSELLDGIVLSSIRSLSWSLLLYALSQSLDFLVMALGFWYGCRLVSRGEYTINQFYLIFVGILFAGQAAGQFFSYSTSITKATGAANYILWLRTLRPVMQETSENSDKSPKKGEGELGLDSVSFHYPQREERVLKDLSMTIKAGQFAAFVGPSGCGKSTMISLLERFYDPTYGCLTFASEPVSNFSPRSYRRQISLVQQEPTLFQGSVRDNIALGVDDSEGPPSEDQIINACKQANAYDFVQSLPEGFATPCGSRGLQFSGGQKQRIAIARALIRKPRLLLLDEATSALDTQSERTVQAALDQAAEGRTTIAVAHRLSTIKHANVIFVFGGGRIVEMGTHAELLRLRGKYYEMCQAQSLDQA